MNAHDRTDPRDALGRRAATTLRADVDRRVDVDAALARVLDDDDARVLPIAATSDASNGRPDRRARLGAAAAVLLVGAGVIAFALGRDDGARVVPADITPVTDGSPITTVTTDQPAPGTSEPTTTPSTVSETSPAPTLTTIVEAPASEIDALAGLAAPTPLDPVEVPAFLPATAVADPSQVRLTQFAMPTDAATRLVQTWATDAGQVLEVSTLLAGGEPPVSAPTDVAPMDVWPWDDAGVVTTMADGFAQVQLADPSGTVTLWGSGYTADELVSIFTRMSLTSDGWRLPDGDAIALVELHSGWRRAEFATRKAQWDTGSAQGELIVALGMPDSIRTGYFGIGTPSTLDDVHGAPALVSEPGSGTVVSWSPAPDVVVVLGFTGSVDEALALARSLEPVDEATWRSAGTDVTSGADGCDSFFFC